MKKIATLIIALLVLSAITNAQVPSPAPEQSEKILILNGTAHLGNGEIIDDAAIGFENGQLTLVANAKTAEIDKAYYDKVIDASGKHIYPGFIAPDSRLGLVEIGAVRATKDFNDVGDFLPHSKSLIAYNTDSKITPTVRSNGVLIAQTTPKGGIVSGTSSVVQLDAWNWEDAVVRKDDGVHLNWPDMFSRTGWWANPGPTKKNEKNNEQMNRIARFFSDARAYSETNDQKEKDLRFEAMRGVFDGSQTLYVHANFVKELVQVINFKKDYSIPNVVIVGGYDAWMIPEVLKENNISIVLRRVHSLPMRPEDDIDLPFKLPKLLHDAGILFCLNNAGSMEAMNTRNLPFYAGTAAAYGLDKEEALKAITLNTAKILGIDDRVGSLEEGKDATLIISTGDALDMRTNNIEYAFINGRQLDLTNHQKQLYQKFSNKYEQQ